MANDQAKLQRFAESEYQETFDDILAQMTYENGLTFGLEEENGGSWFDF